MFEVSSAWNTVVCKGSWMPGANEILGCPGPTRFLDARGQRGSWMPGANEALGWPGPTRFLDGWGERGSWMPGANEVLGCPGPTRFLDARDRADPCILCLEENLHFQFCRFVSQSF